MKVEFNQTVEVDGEVVVSLEDITAALDDKLLECIETGNSDIPTDRTKQFVVMEFVSDVHKCLAGTTNEMICRVAETNRQRIATELRKQAARWDRSCSDE